MSIKTQIEKRRRDLKAAMVEAHRNQDWNAARKLSPKFESVKRLLVCPWPDCGVPLSAQGNRLNRIGCNVHWRAIKNSRIIGFAASLLFFCLPVFSQGIIDSNQFTASSTNAVIMPPPIPPMATNVFRRFVAPNPRQFMLFEFEYTNITFPFQSSTNGVDWTNDMVGTNPTVRVLVPIDQAQPMKLYRAAGAVYVGPWTDIPQNTNSP